MGTEPIESRAEDQDHKERIRMHKTYIGVDNGPTGTIGWVSEAIYNLNKHGICKTPVKLVQDYTKKKKNLSRLVGPTFATLIQGLIHDADDCMAVLERPMKNPTRFNATITAMRMWEAQLTVLEVLGIPHLWIDSKEWQRVLLPSGIVGEPALKKASMEVGIRLFPDHKEFFEQHKDADGLLIAEWARRKGL
jgi:hypothetical protein